MSPGNQDDQNKQPWWKDLVNGAGMMAARYVMNMIPGGASAIPLADGGIIDKPTLATVGEAGPEAIVPVNKWQAGLKMAAGAMGGATNHPSPYQNFGQAAGNAIGAYRAKHGVKPMPGGPDAPLSGAIDQTVGSAPQPVAGPAPIVPDAPWMKKKYYGEE